MVNSAGRGHLKLFKAFLVFAWIVNVILLGLAVAPGLGHGLKYKVVVSTSDAAAAASKLEADLQNLGGVTVERHESTSSQPKPTGKFWVARVKDDEAGANDDFKTLTKWHLEVVKELLGGGRVAVRLKQEYPSQAAAQKGVPLAEQKAHGLLSFKVEPAVRMEKGASVVLDITVTGDDKVKQVETAVQSKGLVLAPEQP